MLAIISSKTLCKMISFPEEETIETIYLISNLHLDLMISHLNEEQLCDLRKEYPNQKIGNFGLILDQIKNHEEGCGSE